MSAHGSKLVSASDDGNVRLWKLTIEGLECVQTFEGYFGFLRSVSFTPDAKVVVVGSGDDCGSDLRFWKIEDGACPQGKLEPTVPSPHSNRLTRRKQASHSGRQLDIHKISEPSYKELGDSMGADVLLGSCTRVRVSIALFTCAGGLTDSLVARGLRLVGWGSLGTTPLSPRSTGTSFLQQEPTLNEDWVSTTDGCASDGIASCERDSTHC